MEKPYNGPGKLTHHRADGTNYLMLKGDEYLNIWPVYDWQKISGTTVLQKPKLPNPDSIQVGGFSDFVGAVTDGLYGAVAFDFVSGHDLVKAKKSWFFFDKEYVCLGTDIHSEAGLPVATTIDQSLLRSDVTVMQGAEVKQLPSGDSELKDFKLAHHNSIGYILPKPATVRLSNQTEKGRWSDITDEKNASKALVSIDVFKLWFDHGTSPDSASYQYIVVPNVSRQELIESSKNNRNLQILANRSNLQAVLHRGLGICEAAFYQAGELAVTDQVTIRMDSQGMAMLKLKDNRVVDLSLSDPSRKLSRMMVTLPGSYQVDGEGVVVFADAKKGNTTLLVDLPQGVYAGKSVTLRLR
jgi:chondroitin AC lyase